MKQRRAVSRKSATPTPDTAPASAPALPAWKAFVVQFSREAGSATGVFSGRVEHLSSGRRARFASKEELIGNLQQLLDEVAVESE